MYLVYGESYRLIDDEIAKICENDTTMIIMDLLKCSLEEIIMEATYVSMFQDKKVLIVKNADFFTTKNTKVTEKEIELLLNYIKNPVTLTTIIFTTYEKIDSRKKITKSFSEKYKIISVNFLNTNDVINKLREYIFSNKYQIDTETLQFIVSLCQNKYDLAYNEINKLFLYYNTPQVIKKDDVEKIVSKSYADNNFHFIESVINKDIKKSLILLNDLLALKVDPIALIVLLAREYRLMYSTKQLLQKGYPKKRIGQELGLQDWQIDKLSRNSAKYYLDELKMNIKKLAEWDYKIKRGKEDKLLALKIFLLEAI